MVNFFICLLIFSVFVLFMAMVYVVANLFFTFKLLIQTAHRLETTMKRLDDVSSKGTTVVENYRRPFLFVSSLVLKIQGIVLTILHIFK